MDATNSIEKMPQIHELTNKRINQY